MTDRTLPPGVGEYDASFFAKQAHESADSAAVVVPMLMHLFQIASVVDIGGGIGAWTAAFRECGVRDVLVVDGDYVDRSQLLIPETQFMQHNLTTPLDLGRAFDLVLCLEVAEHLQPEFGPTLVETLARHGDLIAFSAAIPGQGGTNHVNEEWPSYWSRLFADHGFTLFDLVRPRIWSTSAVGFWFRQNILVFARDLESVSRRSLSAASFPIDIVHPEQFRVLVDAASRDIGIRESTRFLINALKRRARRYLASETRS